MDAHDRDYEKFEKDLNDPIEALKRQLHRLYTKLDNALEDHDDNGQKIEQLRGEIGILTGVWSERGILNRKKLDDLNQMLESTEQDQAKIEHIIDKLGNEIRITKDRLLRYERTSERRWDHHQHPQDLFKALSSEIRDNLFVFIVALFFLIFLLLFVLNT